MHPRLFVSSVILFFSKYLRSFSPTPPNLLAIVQRGQQLRPGVTLRAARSLSRIQSTLQLLLFAPSHNQVLASELNPSDAGARTSGFPRCVVRCWFPPVPPVLRFVHFLPIPTLPDRLDSRFHTSTCLPFFFPPADQLVLNSFLASSSLILRHLHSCAWYPPSECQPSRNLFADCPLIPH